jgi:hypothetical protein
MAGLSTVIHFDVPIENSTVVVHLTAVVTLDDSSPYYVVDNFQYRVISNFRTVHRDRGLLPILKITRKHGRWVHFDSEKETYLSGVVGKAIDLLESCPEQSVSQLN